MMPQIVSNLRVYNEAYALAVEIGKRLETLSPMDRVRGQLVGCSTAICANLSEMAAFENPNQIRQKLVVCIGEANEMAFWISYCKDRNILQKEEAERFLKQCELVAKQLTALKRSVENKEAIR